MKNTEAFVYIWTDSGKNTRYVGVHKGTQDDGYVCSSDVMLKEYAERQEDFTRIVMAVGTYEDMYLLESKMLQESNASANSLYYNLHNNKSPFFHKGPMREDHKKKISESTKNRYTNPIERAKTSMALRTSKKAIEHRKKIHNDPMVRAKQARGYNPEAHARSAESQARLYLITYPDGQMESIKNLVAFCRTHHLDPGNMCRVSQGKRIHYKGFRVVKQEKQ